MKEFPVSNPEKRIDKNICNLFRVLFLKSSKSIKPISSPLKSNSYLYYCLIICQLFTCFNLGTFFLGISGKSGSDRSNFLIYQACYQPDQRFSVPFTNVMPLNALLLYTVDLIIIFGNLYLYRFLQLKTQKKKGS